MNNWVNKINRSKKLLDELKTACKYFSDSHPYKIATKRNPQTNQLIYYLLEIKEVPPNIALISGDVVQNLRSALDHLAYSLFVKETKNRVLGTHIYFPIEKDAQTYETEKTRKTRGISQQVLNIIDRIKPYKGGNDNLWRIHELNRIDKHRLLLTITTKSSFESLDIGAYMSTHMKNSFHDLNIPQISLFIRPADKLFPLKVGDELFIGGPNDKEIPAMEFRFNLIIALNEEGIVEGEPLIELLQSLINEVEKLIPIFDPLIK